MRAVLIVLGGAMVAIEAAFAVLSPSPVTIGLLVFVALMFVLNFSAWRDER